MREKREKNGKLEKKYLDRLQLVPNNFYLKRPSSILLLCAFLSLIFLFLVLNYDARMARRH